MTQISMLTLISHITGQLELKIYYSNNMTERPGETTLHTSHPLNGQFVHRRSESYI